MIQLSRSTAVFAVCLLLSVAVVYRFFHAENKSIFAQRYCPCTPPDGTKHTNVRRVETKYKTFVKDMYYPLIPCGFSALAPLAEMRYTGNTKTNVKERNSRSQNLMVLPAPSERFWRNPLSLLPPRGRLMAMPETLPPLLKPSPWGRWLDAKRQDGRGIPQFFPSPAMIHPAQPYAVRERCRNSVRRQKGGKQTECRFWGGKVVRFSDFDRTFAKDSPPRY